MQETTSFGLNLYIILQLSRIFNQWNKNMNYTEVLCLHSMSRPKGQLLSLTSKVLTKCFNDEYVNSSFPNNECAHMNPA